MLQCFFFFLDSENKTFIYQQREIGIQQREHSETKLKEPLEAWNSHLVLAGRFVVSPVPFQL